MFHEDEGRWEDFRARQLLSSGQETKVEVQGTALQSGPREDATLLKSFPGHHSLPGSGKGRSWGSVLCYAGGRFDTGFWTEKKSLWTRLPHPCVGGVRGWSRQAGSERRWASWPAVQGTEHICLGVSLPGPLPQPLSESTRSLTGCGLGLGPRWGK